MSFVQYRKKENFIFKHDKTVLICIFIFITICTVFDVVEHYYNKTSFYHVIPEILIIFLSTGTFIYLYMIATRSREDIIKSARDEIKKVKEDSDSWQLKAKTLSLGITEAIQEQLNIWHLTKAEQDVCFFLLKGLSIKEISELRNTTERTARQQASEIYKKSGLSGRSQLSAFFLEDLFVIDN